jgi:phosphoglycerate dehydrogenase-like enzyme
VSHNGQVDRIIVAPEWISEGFDLPDGFRFVVGDDLAEVDPSVLGVAEFVVLPYLGSSIPLAEAIARMTHVAVIQTLTAGFDNVVPLVPSGVTLCNAAGVHDVSTAEMAVALTLAALRDLPQSVHAQDRGEWVHYFSRSLHGKTVVLIGYGEVGKATEARLLPFGCSVLPFATTPRDHVRAVAQVPDFLPSADVVVLAVPLNETTHHLVDHRFIALMKPGSLLVNVARGPVVDTDALVAALHAGTIQAALDVTDPEPLPADHPLWSAPGTLIAPHLGGDTDAFASRARRRAHDQLARWTSGQSLECVVLPPG